MSLRITSPAPVLINSINCGTSTPKLSGTVYLTSFISLTSFTCSNNDIQSIIGFDFCPNIHTFVCNDNKIFGNFSELFPALNTKKSLTDFNIHNNRIYGTITSLEGLTALDNFYISNNPLSGSIPNLNSLISLRNFRAENCQLSGVLPSLSALSSLQTLRINSNFLSGPIPHLSANIALVDFIANNNLFTGNIPDLSNNRSITTLSLNTTLLSGAIPSLSANRNIVNFSVGNSSLINGSLPSLENLSAIQTFGAAAASISGSIPSLSANKTLTSYQVNSNQLTGSIPALNALTALSIFRVDTNQLTGFAGGPIYATNFNARSNKLTTAAVNSILAGFVSAGKSFASPGGGVIDLDGPTGINSGPSLSGITDVATLTSRNWTVVVNPYLPETLIWVGLGTNNNWTTDSNWDKQYAPFRGDNLIFAGSTRLVPFNNFTYFLPPLSGISFASGAGVFALSGNILQIGSGGITNNSSNRQIITNNIILSSNTGAINCNTAAIILSGNISGTGNLTKTGASLLSLSGNNTYTGNTFILSGGVRVFNSNPFGTGNVYIQTPTPQFVSFAFTIEQTAAPETVIINSPIYLSYVAGPNDVGFQVNKSTIFNKPIIFTNSGNPATPNQNSVNPIGSGSTVTFNGGISGTPTWTSTLVRLEGAASNSSTIILSSSPVIFDISTVNFNLFNSTTVIAVSGNRFQTLRLLSSNIRCDVPFAINNDSISLIDLGGPSTNIDLNGNDQRFRNITDTVRPDCNIINSSSTFANLTANCNNPSTYYGSISGNINLIKTGVNTLTLSGDISLGHIGAVYTGFTAISGTGALITYALSSNPSNKVNFASFINTTLTVNFTTPPSIGDSFVLLPGRTLNSYPAVTLQNGGGRTASYNSTTSTLSVIS